MEYYPSLAGYINLAKSANNTAAPRRHTQSKLVDAYFTFAHDLLPILDETAFRVEHNEPQSDGDGDRRPALVNMVLSMGSLAQTQLGNTDHAEYYKRATESLHTSQGVEALQALLIMGGQYLPLVHQQAEAEAMIAKAITLAGIIGLEVLAQGHNATWRRTLWCLHCLHSGVVSRPFPEHIDMVTALNWGWRFVHRQTR